MQRPSALIDTGVIVALIDSRDGRHVECADVFSKATFPLLTSQAVLTEAFHLVGSSPRDRSPIWNWIDSGVIVQAIIPHEELSRIRILMNQYADHPMDFADATLVHLAEREQLSTIYTIDYSDFTTYRIGRGKRFRILPDRPR